MTKQTKSIPVRHERVSDPSFSADAADPYLINLTWTTGFKGLRNDAGGKYFEELAVTDAACDLSRLSNNAPVLANHDLSGLNSVIGKVEKAWIAGGKGYATIRLSRRQDVAGTIQDIQDGILRNVSVGYQISQMTDTSASGDKIPTYMATKWQPYEISIVAVPFDPMAQTQRAANEASLSEVEFLTRNQDANMSTTDNETPLADTVAPVADVVPAPEGERSATAVAGAAAVKAGKKKMPPTSKDSGDSEPDEDDQTREDSAEQGEDDDEESVTQGAKDVKAAKSAKADKAGRALAITEERNRALEITKAVKAAGLSTDVAVDMVARGIAMSEASTEIFAKLEKSEPKTSGVNRNKETDMSLTVRAHIEAAMLNRIAPSQNPLPAEALDFKGQSLLRAFEAILPRERGEGSVTYATRVMTTSDLPSLLANIANKQLRISYDEQKPTYTEWAKIGTLPDFKSAKLIQVSVFPALQVVGEGANYPASSMSDQAETIALSSYGIVLSFSRQMLMNDDLSALASFSSRAAAAAQRNCEKLAYAQLTGNPVMADTNALFSVAHSNIAATPTAITIASLALAKAAMRFQADPTGAPLNLTPSYLIVGPSKEVEAMQFVNSTFVPNSASTVNPFAGTLKVIVSAQITGTKWYLAADKSLIDTVGVYFLEGMESPQVQSRQNFENGATDIKVIHDVAALPLDYRGLYYNAGA